MLDKHDRYVVISTMGGLAIWWLFIGHKKYGMKGMK